VVVMYRGFIVEEGRTGEIFTETAHPYTKLLISSVPGVRERFRALESEEEVDKGCPFYPRCPYRKRDCLEFKMELLPLSQSHRVACLLFS